MAERAAFDRATLEKAFEGLGRLAVAAGKVVDISIYGGSAVVLTLDTRHPTRDVDAVFDRDGEFVRMASATIGEEHGWRSDWLNDGVKGFLSERDADRESKGLFRSYPIGGEAGVRIFVAAPDYLFAMKCLAMRIGGVDSGQDLQDIRDLGRLLHVTGASEALALVGRYYPDNRIPPKTRFGIEQIFGPEAKAKP
jgi:hypothetical protein